MFVLLVRYKCKAYVLEKNGFVKCGIIHVFEDDYPRYAYEKTGELFR